MRSTYNMTSHTYNTRHSSLVSNEYSTPETSQLTINLENKLLSRFDNLGKEILNLKDGITKDLQVENQRLRNKINNLEKSNLTGRNE